MSSRQHRFTRPKPLTAANLMTEQQRHTEYQPQFGLFTRKLHRTPLTFHFLKNKTTCTPVPLQTVSNHVCVREGAAVF